MLNVIFYEERKHLSCNSAYSGLICLQNFFFNCFYNIFVSGFCHFIHLLVHWFTCVYLVTLLICSLYNLLVFAVLCQFVIVSTLVVSCPALPCGVVLFVCFCFLINKSPSLCTTESSPYPLPNPDNLVFFITIFIKPHFLYGMKMLNVQFSTFCILGLSTFLYVQFSFSPLIKHFL